MSSFRESMDEPNLQRASKLIFALDRPRSLHSLPSAERTRLQREHFRQCRSLLSEVSDHIAGVKINYPLVLTLGPGLTSDLLDSFDGPAIADFKVADTANTSRWITTHALDMGFDAVIAHPFVGFEGGLSGLFEEARSRDAGIILVVNMSHPGSREFITPEAQQLTNVAIERNADGVIAPATRPREVTRVRSWIEDDMLLLTPGIGAQGGQPGDAVKAGADFEIVGRAIYQADRPGESARRIKEQIDRTEEEP